MISLPLPVETQALIESLSTEEKAQLALFIKAFVSKPSRPISQVMDEMTEYARQQGLTPEKLDDLLNQ